MNFRMRIELLISWTAIMLGALSVFADEPRQQTDQQGLDFYAKTLELNGISASSAGLTRYLQALVPSEQERRQYLERVAMLVGMLGDKDFDVREQATRQLASMPDLPAELVEEALASADPEVSFRAQAILSASRRHENQAGSIQFAVFRTIERQQLKGLASILVEVIPLLEQPYVVLAARDALAATAEAGDDQRLLEWLRHPHAEVRIAAAGALARLQGAESVKPLHVLLVDDELRVRLAAARALANLGDRLCLPALEKLLYADDLAIRTEAVMILRALTGQGFDFIPSLAEAERTKAAARWSEWIENAGETADLVFPLDMRSPEIGHTLVLLFGQSLMIELDENGDEVSRLGDLKFPWAVQPLPNGNRLIGSYRGKFLVEFDASGKEVWRRDGMPGGVFGVQRLENGNTLAACHDGKCVVEVDRDGKIVWQAKVDGNPMDAQRLENGNTLVATSTGRSVIEIDREGKIVWQIAGLGTPRTAIRLANGNTLVCDAGKKRVDEFDPEGKSVWAITDLTAPFSAQRLSNGHTLITDKVGIRIFGADKQTVWEKKMAGVGRAVRY